MSKKTSFLLCKDQRTFVNIPKINCGPNKSTYLPFDVTTTGTRHMNNAINNAIYKLRHAFRMLNVYFDYPISMCKILQYYHYDPYERLDLFWE